MSAFIAAAAFPDGWRIPVAQWVTDGLDWLIDNGDTVFSAISSVLRFVLLNLEVFVLATPWWVVVLVTALAAMWASGWKLALASTAGMVFIGAIGMWELAMATLALVLTATLISVAMGVPLGVLAARSDSAWRTMRPTLDLMQTMPSFVYLVPALMLFGLGRVPALIATIAYAVPPTIRLTNHGIRQVAAETVEAALSFGATRRQLLRKVQLPLAFPTIMAGVNQTIMMALAMVVIASMIGAGGLGREVLEGLARLDVGRAFLGGIGIVVLAVTIDRIAAQASRPARERGVNPFARLSAPLLAFVMRAGRGGRAAVTVPALDAESTTTGAPASATAAATSTAATAAPTIRGREHDVDPSDLDYLVVEGLWKVFGGDRRRAIRLAEEGVDRETILAETGATVALRDVDLTIPRGQTFVIMGLSGSGKSTLVRCLNRLIEPTRGTITLGGVDIVGLPTDELLRLRRDSFGMVFQSFALMPHHTVARNAGFGLELQGIDEQERTARAAASLEKVGLTPWADAYPDELSGGMKQRVGLARALTGDPDVLLMDEPFSALDPLMRTQMQDELLNLQAELRKTIVFITHDLDEALKLGSTIAILRDGEVAQVGTPEEILRDPADEYVRAFVEKVDRSPILRASDVMFRPKDLVRPFHAPAIALRLMEQEGRSASFVLEGDSQLLGILTADDAARAALAGQRDISSVIRTVTDVCTPDTPIGELVHLATTQPHPLAVVDHGRFVGVVARVSLLRALGAQRLGPTTAALDGVDDAERRGDVTTPPSPVGV
jgi:glycine betaine/proline transport system ATP-binding protein